jgi:hypothetical protein
MELKPSLESVITNSNEIYLEGGILFQLERIIHPVTGNLKKKVTFLKLTLFFNKEGREGFISTERLLFLYF